MGGVARTASNSTSQMTARFGVHVKQDRQNAAVGLELYDSNLADNMKVLYSGDIFMVDVNHNLRKCLERQKCNFTVKRMCIPRAFQTLLRGIDQSTRTPSCSEAHSQPQGHSRIETGLRLWNISHSFLYLT